MKALVGGFNQEKALVGAFLVIVKLRVILSNLRFKLYTTHRTPDSDGQSIPRFSTSGNISQLQWTAAAAGASNCAVP